MVSPIDAYLARQMGCTWAQVNDALDRATRRAVFADLKWTSLAEFIRRVLDVGEDQLEQEYENYKTEIKALIYDALDFIDISEKLLDHDMALSGVSEQGACEIVVDGRPLCEVVKQRCKQSLKYPRLPCVKMYDIIGRYERSYVPLECILLCNGYACGSPMSNLFNTVRRRDLEHK